jgi:hypothetical protein
MTRFEPPRRQGREEKQNESPRKPFVPSAKLEPTPVQKNIVRVVAEILGQMPHIFQEISLRASSCFDSLLNSRAIARG